MNRLDQPAFDDAAALTALSLNELVNSYPALQEYLPAIIAGYENYVAARGNAFDIIGVALPDNIEGFLRGHYASPPQDLFYIKLMRDENGPECCPMCGALHSGTLDHLLPQNDYAAFAVLTANLLPACRCNSLRGTTLTGPHPEERILHPYFDDVLGQRLLAARFEDLGLVPRASLSILLPADHADFAAVQFHVTKVVEPNYVMTHLRNSWTKLLRKPSKICVALEKNPPSRAWLVTALGRQLDHEDDFHGSRNNWRSIFIKGLLDDPVIDWLLDRFSAAGRAPDEPLLPGAL